MRIITNIAISMTLIIINTQFLITNQLNESEIHRHITEDYFADNNSNLMTQSDTTNESNIDTLKPQPLEDFVSQTAVSKKTYTMTKSPTTAVLLSLLLPGAGQLYNESYWKVPLFLGATGALTYLIFENHKKYSDEQKRYDLMEATNPERSRSKVIKEYYRDQRDQDIFYLTGVYIISAIDAYVGAHLYDFNVSDDLTLKLKTQYTYGFRVSLVLEW